ncbi:COR domain-containing protein [Candidatus Bathycorpusculum sp.]|uniref:COR domain-containing protein n=1 Tax=Candidatus Bathycorpusculum sp. TaxID=2994959 RepID=UPI00282CFA29|nr:hypothetical protein [Candidatus Termitimicrobium sp.]
MGKDFREQIQESLSDFSREDACFFAWLCAVRALPFLALKGNFDYWKHSYKRNQRQKHLFAVLNALDVTYAAARAANAATTYADAAYYAARAADDATIHIRAADDARAARAADAAARAADAAADAAIHADAADRAANAAIHADRAANAARINLMDILLDDLEIIKAGKRNFKSDTDAYGLIWLNFQRALRDLGCEYWGEWYAKVFANGFMLDKADIAEIELRLNVPKEIMELGATDVAIFVRKMKKGVMRLNEARIILLGEAGAGKTSIARRLKNPNEPMPERWESTEGVDITSFTLRDICSDVSVEQDANVYVWDFAGHAITHAAHRCFLSERCVYIILYDGRAEGRNRLEYWLNHARDYGKESQVFVLVNLIKGVRRPDIPERYITKHYEKQNCKFYYFSIKDDDEKLLEFRADIAHFIATNPAWNKDVLPIDYFVAKEALKATFGDRDYIEIEDLKKVAPDVNEDMLKHLRELGICLHYPDIKGLQTYVLNPEWITWGIYHIINWLKDTKRAYQLTQDDFYKIFAKHSAKYPDKQYDFLYKVMRKFELAYEDTNRQVLVVPQCLDEYPPSDILEPPKGNRLSIVFEAKQEETFKPMPFPSDVIPRVIIKRSAEASFYLSRVWRYGAVLYPDDDTYAFIEQTDNTIVLRVTGKNREAYMAILFGTVLEVIATYDSFIDNKPNISCEILEYPGKMYPLQQLINLYVDGEKVCEDKGSRMFFDVIKNTESYVPKNTPNYFIENYFVNHVEGTGNTAQIIRPDKGSRVVAPQIIISVNDLEKLKCLIEGAQKGVAGTANVSDETKDEVSKILKELEKIREELVKDPSKRGLLEKVWSKLKGIKEPVSLGADFLALLAFILPLIPKG